MNEKMLEGLAKLLADPTQQLNSPATINGQLAYRAAMVAIAQAALAASMRPGELKLGTIIQTSNSLNDLLKSLRDVITLGMLGGDKGVAPSVGDAERLYGMRCIAATLAFTPLVDRDGRLTEENWDELAATLKELHQELISGQQAPATQPPAQAASVAEPQQTAQQPGESPLP